MVYKDVSLELRNKIRKHLIISPDEYSGHGNFIGCLEFNDNESHLFEECIIWYNIIHKYFGTTYDCYRLTKIGRFEDLRPFEIYNNMVKFSVVDYNDVTWKDWFDITGENDGYLRGSVGMIINERTCKYASL